MNLRQYLSAKYDVDVPTIITKREARIFGIPYPLTKGWLQAFGHIEIGPTMARKLGAINLDRAKETKSPRAKRYAEHGVKASKEAGKIASWTPSIDPSRDDFLRTYEWRRVRMQALKKYGARCQCCGATADKGVRVHVDHIKPRKLFPQLALDVNNLQILCEECNHGKGNWDMTDWRTGEKADA